MSFHVGEDIGDYRIVSMIGAGSMGQVFQVEHRLTKRKEALKVLEADRATECQAERFQREIEVQARLDHPNIARVHNALRVDRSFILVMELVEGESLEKKLQKGTISRAAGVGLICQVLSALEYAHSRGIVHRDVTPANLLIDPSGQVKLTDFGVAKSLGDYQLTNAGEIVGSLYYMPPEQVRRQADPDLRSDIYSAAAVLYEILTGKKLFALNDRLSLMVAQVEQQPIPPIEIDPTIGAGMNGVVLKALAKNPTERYQSAQEFRQALESLATETTAAAESIPSLPPAAVARKRKHSTAMPIAAAVLTVLAFAFAGVAKISTAPEVPAPPKPAPIVGIGTLLDLRDGQAYALPDLEPTPRPVVTKPATRQNLTAAEQPAPQESANAPADDSNPMPEETAEKAPPAEDTSGAAVDTAEPATEPVAAAAEPPAPTRKKGFWSKLNPFKKKKEDPAH
jgi:serine/threonine-protein kinase